MVTVKAIDMLIKALAPPKALLIDEVGRHLFETYLVGFALGKFSTMYGWKSSTKAQYIEILKRFVDLKKLVVNRLNAYLATIFIDPLPKERRHDIAKDHTVLIDRLSRLHCPNCGHKIDLEVTS